MNALEQTIAERFKALLRQGLTAYRLVLFGSRARGDSDAYSDMDILVILDGESDEKTRQFVSDCAWEAGYEQGVVIVPVVFSKREWEDGPERFSLLAKAVQQEGVAL
jgi:uncharacterized protein